MPHVVLRGAAALERVWRELPRGPWRWGRAVARVEGCYLAPESKALLVAGVVVELGRPLHPVVLITPRDGATAVHLWPVVPLERTEAVLRFIVQVATELRAFGAGDVETTNLASLFPWEAVGETDKSEARDGAGRQGGHASRQ